MAVVARGGRTELRCLQGADAQLGRLKKKCDLHQAIGEDRPWLLKVAPALLLVLLLPHEDQNCNCIGVNEGNQPQNQPLY
jgi:hypothetical protein